LIGANAGAKKNRQVRWRFSREFWVLFRARSLLSIRLRPEIPKEVKVKLGGQHGLERRRLVEKGTRFITWLGAAGNPHQLIMRVFRVIY
jgi:hypothetical protein